ncbi:hypothetical protein J2T10_000098 [Paenarthrobacter nicotinovorans]|uniref:Uncharacterized protein n=1 Tax=Paenarthrobacter nicotinovorans TaxID=29320 RepID=A0ABT9TFU5_PAENI|nr:hypothetical protein [Paenarthrobacter nicotinovorans]MDQ0100479.1 hypothetical protein [Paenarthrobacter nicotinovorans]
MKGSGTPRKKKPTLAQKIAKRLVEMGEVDPKIFDVESAQIERFYPGHWQRSAGCWSWCLNLKRLDGQEHVGRVYGSQFTATECAVAKDWHFFATGPDIGITPWAGENYIGGFGA